MRSFPGCLHTRLQALAQSGYSLGPDVLRETGNLSFGLDQDFYCFRF